MSLAKAIAIIVTLLVSLSAVVAGRVSPTTDQAAFTLLPLQPHRVQVQPAQAADNVAYLRFWVNGGVDGGQLMRVFIEGNQGEDVRWIVAADGWTFFEIPIASLAPPDQIETLVFEILGEGAQTPVYIDDIEWVLH